MLISSGISIVSFSHSMYFSHIVAYDQPNRLIQSIKKLKILNIVIMKLARSCISYGWQYAIESHNEINRKFKHRIVYTFRSPYFENPSNSPNQSSAGAKEILVKSNRIIGIEYSVLKPHQSSFARSKPSTMM